MSGRCEGIQKVIDFHTHIFPEKIAQKTIHALEKRASIKAYTDGTLSGLEKSMDQSGVTLSVIQPVITRPEQFSSINEYARKLNLTKSNILSFGAVHPSSEHYKEELKALKDMGFKGIKIHPDYQDMNFDDIRMMHLVNEASRLDLSILVHAGIDIGLPSPVHCTPAMAERVINEVQPKRLVLAHMGGWKCYDEVEERLIGRNVFLDTAFSLEYMQPEQLLQMIRNHGSERILFATDSPWSGQKEYVNQISHLPLEEAQIENILYRNAEALLQV